MENTDNRYKIFFDNIYSIGDLLKRYNKIYDLFEDILDNKEESEEKFREIVLYINEFDKDEVESGMLRTILVCLKAFKYNEIISDIYNRISARYLAKNKT